MKRILLSLGILLNGVLLLTAAPAATRPPNFVFFFVDDLGARDLGCYGSTFYETPNLDRLAREGAKFTKAYAACPVCSPSRAAIQTGKYPVRTSITDYIGAAGPDKWNRNTKLLPAAYSDRLAHDEVTIAEALKAGGYATFFAGKWHLGPEGWFPENHGYDINKGGIDKGGPYGGNKYFSPYGNPRLEDGPPGEHLPDRLATETGKFMAANKDRPFFAFFSFYSVHTPLMARKDLEAKYAAKATTVTTEPEFGDEPPRAVRLVQKHAVYGGMVEAMDQAVGKVLQQLDELGLAENTVVIFTSDNGGLSTSEGSPTSNLPLRAGKGWLYEGGIREPLLIRWPKGVKPGTVIDTPVSGPDYYPTMLELAGLPARPQQHRDGVSLVSLLRTGKLGVNRALYWHYPHYGNQGGAPGAAIREGDWKLIEWFEGNRVELFNVTRDEGEQRNLATQEPERVKTLLASLHAWQKEAGAVFPTPNPKYDPTKPDGRAAPTPQNAAKKAVEPKAKKKKQ
jgi:arylsulfatase A-like enzyme